GASPMPPLHPHGARRGAAQPGQTKPRVLTDPCGKAFARSNRHWRVTDLPFERPFEQPSARAHQRSLDAGFDARRDGLGGSAEAVRLCTHAPVLGRGLVVPAEEGQETVREQHRHLGAELALARFGLSARGRNAHAAVSEEAIGWIAELAVALGERQPAGRAILPPIDMIELLDLIVARE